MFVEVGTCDTFLADVGVGLDVGNAGRYGGDALAVGVEVVAWQTFSAGSVGGTNSTVQIIFTGFSHTGSIDKTEPKRAP